METTVIDASGMSLRQRLNAFRQGQTMFRFLMQRDIQLRYRRPWLGVLWALLQPALTTILSALVFARTLSGTMEPAVPYWLHVLSGLAVWTFFSSALNTASVTLVQNQNLLNKVWFPRAILPFAAASALLVDLAISLTALLGLSSWAGFGPSLRWLLLVPALAALYLFTLAASLLLASLSALSRDAKHAFAFLLQVWMLATPVLYPLSLLRPEWRQWLGLNPMAGLLEAIRRCLFGGPPAWSVMAASLVGAALIAAAALVLFHRLEDDLAERV